MSRIRPAQLLAAAALASVAFHLWESRDQWLISDETYFVGYLRGFNADAILGSDAGNLVAIPLLIYNGSWELFGIETILPLRLVWAAFAAVTAVLFFLLARKRAGDWVALWPAVLLLFFGAAGEVHSTSIGMTHVLATSFGLGALLCLDRSDRAGDLGALALLCAACVTYTTGIAFLAGAAVDLARRRRFDRMAGAIVLVPVLLYAAWRLWIAASDETSLSVGGLLAVGPTSIELFAAAVTAITGTFQFAREPFAIDPGNEVFASTWGLVLGAVAVGLGVWRYRIRDRVPLNGRIWAYLAILAVYWTMLAAKNPPIIDSEISRYTYLGAIMLLLVGAELLAGVRLERRWRAVLLGGFAFSLLANAILLHDAAKFDRIAADRNRAQLGAVELAGETVPAGAIEPLPSFVLTDPYWDMFVTIAAYLDAVEEFGSAGYSPEEILRRPEHVRRYADEQLVSLLEPAARPAPAAGPPATGARLAVDASTVPLAADRRACVRLDPRAGGTVASFTLPAGGVHLRAARGTAPRLSLRRFADGYYLEVPGPAAGTSAKLRPPGDRSEVPWHLRASAGSPLTLCPL